MPRISTNIRAILRKSARLSAGWLAFSLMAFLLSSCVDNEGVEYSSFVDIESGGIPRDWEFEFMPVPADSADIGKVPFDVLLVVRYSDACVSRELPLNIEMLSLVNENPDTLKVNVNLFDEANEPLGKGIYSIYEKTDTLLRGVTLPDGFSLSLSSPVEPSATRGVKAIGIVAARSGVGHKARYVRNVW